MFRERKWEVLFLYDPWDEFVMEHLREFDGKPLRLAEKADLNLNHKKEGALPEEAAKRSPNGSRKSSATKSAKCASPSGWSKVPP